MGEGEGWGKDFVMLQFMSASIQLWRYLLPRDVVHSYELHFLGCIACDEGTEESARRAEAYFS
jgi:hypothetical protein